MFIFSYIALRLYESRVWHELYDSRLNSITYALIEFFSRLASLPIALRGTSRMLPALFLGCLFSRA